MGYIISTMASSMMALRSLARTAAPRAAVRPAASLAVARRFASSSSTQQDPKAKANALIDALPGNSLVSKTGILTLGTAISAVAISKELFVVNEEVVVLASFTILIAFLAKIIRAPYSEWAESQIERIKGILNQSRSAHTPRPIPDRQRRRDEGRRRPHRAALCPLQGDRPARARDLRPQAKDHPRRRDQGDSRQLGPPRGPAARGRAGRARKVRPG